MWNNHIHVKLDLDKGKYEYLKPSVSKQFGSIHSLFYFYVPANLQSVASYSLHENNAQINPKTTEVNILQ